MAKNSCAIHCCSSFYGAQSLWAYAFLNWFGSKLESKCLTNAVIFMFLMKYTFVLELITWEKCSCKSFPKHNIGFSKSDFVRLVWKWSFVFHSESWAYYYDVTNVVHLRDRHYCVMMSQYIVGPTYARYKVQCDLFLGALVTPVRFLESILQNVY